MKALAIINGYFLFLMSAIAALFSIPGKAGFAECRTTQIGIMSADWAFWEIPPLFWPILSCLCLALSILSLHGFFSKSNIVVPFVPTLFFLLVVVFQTFGVYSVGSRFLECVVNG